MILYKNDIFGLLCFINLANFTEKIVALHDLE